MTEVFYRCNSGRLLLGDNLELLRSRVADEAVHLVYLDPPFNSRRDHTAFEVGGSGKRAGRKPAFSDTWRWDDEAEQALAALTSGDDDWRRALGPLVELSGRSAMGAYLVFMAPRLAELHRVLAPGGSIFLHCDQSAGHFLRLLLDAVFGAANFRNEIVWCYTGPSNVKRHFPRKHDVILYYAKDAAKASFHPERLRVPYAKSLEAARRRTGIFAQADYPDLDGRIAAYDQRGKLVEDWWADITPVGRRRNEVVGYPTQKPLALLERIINAASDPGDTVLDPFAGSGTTLAAAAALGRHWIGIDDNRAALDIAGRRIEEISEDDRAAV